MTKKHYIALAKALNEQRPNVLGLSPQKYRNQYDQWFNDCCVVADTLENMSKTFDRCKFMTVCRGDTPPAEPRDDSIEREARGENPTGGEWSAEDILRREG